MHSRRALLHPPWWTSRVPAGAWRPRCRRLFGLHEASACVIEPLDIVHSPRIELMFCRRGGAIGSHDVAIPLLCQPISLPQAGPQLRASRLCVEHPILVLGHVRYRVARDDWEVPTHVGARSLGEGGRREIGPAGYSRYCLEAFFTESKRYPKAQGWS